MGIIGGGSGLGGGSGIGGGSRQEEQLCCL